MNKIIALYRNEMSRIFRKTSHLILIGLLVILCIALPLLVNAGRNLFLGEFGYNLDSLTEMKQQNENQISTMKASLENSNPGYYPPGDPSGDTDYQEAEILRLEKENLRIDYLLTVGYENNVVQHNQDFIVDASYDMIDYMDSAEAIRKLPESEQTPWYEQCLSFYENSITVIRSFPKTRDFRSYIDLLIKESALLSQNPDYQAHKEFLDMDIDNLELIYLADPTGGTDGTYSYSAALEVARSISGLNDFIEGGCEYTYNAFSGETIVPISPAKRTFYLDSIKVMEHQIATNTFPSGVATVLANLSKNMVQSVGKFFVGVLVLMVAGSTISQEIATGSIKSLIIAPVRRWKILTAKILSVLSVLALSLFLMSVISTLSCSAVFGAGSLVDYVYANAHSVGSIPYMIYDVLSAFVKSVDLLVLALFALLLSTTLRNTAFAVAASIGAYFSISLLSAMLISLPIPRQMWMDFMPFMNLDLNNDIFRFSMYTYPSDLSNELAEALFSVRPGLLFTSIYLVVLITIMVLGTYDSFSKRDI
ncbi:MAG: ABC transporter permease subunit [Oscillospiraceae bacterium]|nr:ABC transporter permease subunit [Oscillospiraceae bacterium]